MVPSRPGGLQSHAGAVRTGLTPRLITPLTPETTYRWWQALNPAIYLVSILPGVAAWLLAPDGLVVHSALWPATAAVVLLQHAVNLFNDAKDWQLGADIHKYDSWVRVHGCDPRIAHYHGLISLLAGGAVGLSVLVLHQQLWILSFALPLVLLGVLYNAGRRPLSYTVAGEWVTALCYGPGVFGGLWLVAGQSLDGLGVLGMAAFAAFSMALLLSHQPPQIETDRQAGKLSFAVRHGKVLTYRVATGLYLLSLTLLSLGVWLSRNAVALPIVFTALALVAAHWVARTSPNPKRILLSASLVFLIALPAGQIRACDVRHEALMTDGLRLDRAVSLAYPVPVTIKALRPG